jgi:hypothetical protein
MERSHLHATIARHAAELDRFGSLLHVAPSDIALGEELRLLAGVVLDLHDRQMPLMVELQRGGEAVADLAVLAREEVVDRGHRYAVEWLKRKIADGGFPTYDTEAVAAVALGSLLAYAAQCVTFGGPPLGVARDRFVETWVEAWLRVASTAEQERSGA